MPGLDLTAELITHRFTPGSKEVRLGWYPRTRLEMDESARSRRYGRFGAVKYVYPRDTMAELREDRLRSTTVALTRVDFHSEVLGLGTSMTVILPQHTSSQVGMSGAAPPGDPPVLYLLHGLSDDDTIWLRRTSIERYVAPLGLAVVMPQVGRSFYSDEEHGNRYWTFLTDELPRLCHGFFRLSARREDTFVAGLSMGGYGALKWALRDPGRFAAAASLSGALDVAARRHATTAPLDPAVWHIAFGERTVAGSDDDLLALLGRTTGADLPALRVACGTEDFLYEDNLTFVTAARERGVPLTVDFSPGAHDWAYWDAKIQDVLAWLPLRTGA